MFDLFADRAIGVGAVLFHLAQDGVKGPQLFAERFDHPVDRLLPRVEFRLRRFGMCGKAFGDAVEKGLGIAFQHFVGQRLELALQRLVQPAQFLKPGGLAAFHGFQLGLGLVERAQKPVALFARLGQGLFE